jgi:hypothetical protein
MPWLARTSIHCTISHGLGHGYYMVFTFQSAILQHEYSVRGQRFPPPPFIRVATQNDMLSCNHVIQLPSSTSHGRVHVERLKWVLCAVSQDCDRTVAVRMYVRASEVTLSISAIKIFLYYILQ